jgi:hypothetical protein
MIFLILLLSASGFALVMEYGMPVKPIREYLIKDSPLIEKLFKCSLCLGWWSGLIHAITLIHLNIAMSILNSEINWMLFVASFCLPFASAAFNWAVDSAILCMQSIEIYLDNKK